MDSTLTHVGIDKLCYLFVKYLLHFTLNSYFVGLVHKDKRKSMVVSNTKRKRRSAAGQSDFYKDYFQVHSFFDCIIVD